jgi:hypothetical protein
MPKKIKRADSPFTVEMNPELKQKFNLLYAFCVANGVTVSKGCIIRMFIENASESVEFLGMVRMRGEKEKEHERLKRGHAAKG